MTAEALVEFAGGHGIDLISAAESGLRTDGVARVRRLTFAERLERAGRPALPTVIGAQTRVTRKGAWSQHDLGHALAGCRRTAELAAWFAWGRDDKHFAELCRQLMLVALHAAETDRWPPRLSHGEIAWHYVPALTNLVFEADRHAQFYAGSGALHAARMGVNLDTWYGRLEGRFLHLRGRYEGWLDEALDHISRWLRGGYHTHPIDRAANAH